MNHKGLNRRELSLYTSSAPLHLANTGTGITLTPHQQAAHDLLMRFARGQSEYAMALLEGYAGTGKTTLVAQLTRTLMQHMRLAIAAPTNKAVKVLREKMGLSESTAVEFGSVHSFLGLRLAEREDGTQDCKKESESKVHEYDLLIVDECSMLTPDIFRQIVLEKRETLVLFVGDSAQLPPVKGNGELSPVFSQVTHKAVLSEVVRQARDNPIIAMSIMIRQHMAQSRAVDPMTIAEFLPAPKPGATAVLTGGGRQTAIQFALHELQANRDARVIAFTNEAVRRYNREIHEALYGLQAATFVGGERAMMQEAFEAMMASEFMPKRVTLHTSEEVIVESLHEAKHPIYDAIPAYELSLRRDNGEQVTCFVAQDQVVLRNAINDQFAKWRALQTEGNHAEAKAASRQAWALRNAFAPLVHCYAITAHKSQGSTFDTAIVDYQDMARMRSPFEFNRALYVAVTRPSKYLAIVA